MKPANDNEPPEVDINWRRVTPYLLGAWLVLIVMWHLASVAGYFLSQTLLF